MRAYRHMMLKVGGVLALAAAFAISSAGSAEAAHMLRLTQGVNSLTLTDDGACVAAGSAACFTAADPVAGQGGMALTGSVGNFGINVTTGLSKGALGSATSPHLDLSSVNVSGGAGTLVLEHTDTNFTGGGTSGFLLAIGGTNARGFANVSYSAFFDTANTAFGQGSLIASIGPLAGPSFSGVATGPGPLSTPFSLTQLVTLVHTRATTTSFDVELIPEPATLALFGISLVGVGLAARRRRRALEQ